MVFKNGRLKEPVSFPKSDDEWHSFLKGNFEDALTIKRFVESLLPTAATFRLKIIADELDTHPNQVDRRLVKLTGSWEMPDLLASTTGPKKFVNPNYEHAYHYSDCVVECDCGAPIVRQRYSENEKMPTYHDEHTDDCTRIARLEARAQVLRNRKQAIEELYMLGHNLHRGIPRIGYSGGNNNIGKTEVKDIGVDLQELYRIGRERLVRTLMVLLREHPTSEVAELYDISKSSLTKMIREESDSDSKVLYRYRKTTGSH